MSNNYARDAAAIVRRFQHGESLAAAFTRAAKMSNGTAYTAPEKNERLSIVVGLRNQPHLTQFSVLYGLSLNRLGLTEKGKVTMINWRELMLAAGTGPADLGAVAAATLAALEPARGGIAVITDAYAGLGAGPDQQAAARQIEQILNVYIAANGPVVMTGTPADLRGRFGTGAPALLNGVQKIGF